MIRKWVGVMVVASLCWTGRAKAEPYEHDGFQFRATLGGGYLSDGRRAEGLQNGSSEATVSGGAALLELYLGGTLAPGLVLGVYLSGMAAPGPSVKVGGTTFEASDDASLGLGSIGPYINYYPDHRNAQSGFHLLASLGYAQVTLDDGDGTSDESDSSGFALGGGVGYDAFVAEEWALGALGRFGYAWTSQDIWGVTLHDDAWMLGLSFSVSCH